LAHLSPDEYTIDPFPEMVVSHPKIPVKTRPWFSIDVGCPRFLFFEIDGVMGAMLSRGVMLWGVAWRAHGLELDLEGIFSLVWLLRILVN
jgi:hypothetical protein